MFSLQWWRDEISDHCAHRMACHLTHWADEHGGLTDMPRVMRAYAATHDLSVRTAWKDLGRLTGLGLVRQVHAAAPGRPARYALCLDLARLPPDFPKDLGRAIEKVADDPVERAKGRPTLASTHAALARCVLVQYGGALSREKTVSFGCGLVHTSPYIGEGSTPPRARSPRRGGRDDHRRASGGRKSNDGQPTPWWKEHGYDDLQDARDVLRACQRHWRVQRTGRVAPGTEVPSDSELARLENFVVLLRRYVTFGESVEILTDQIASARNVAGVVRYRIGRLLRSFRRRQNIKVDEDGEGYLEMQERLAAARAQSSPEVRREAVAKAHEIAARAALKEDVVRARRIDREVEEMLQAEREKRRRQGEGELLRTEAAALAEEQAEAERKQRHDREENRRLAIMRARREKALRNSQGSAQDPAGEAAPAAPERPGPAPEPGPASGSGPVAAAPAVPPQAVPVIPAQPPPADGLTPVR
ncbi:hypothetical protein HS041_36825 [Planomonospora sp. ID67723]|uniref:hypothetical protein n=1 Tax=Planomonospora sp. ID67723 TaxID=2738134 RepID=UPI0018C419B3|nr:hypothetical protein [Planomonospora sp. ID67723]MBG0833268.1 hypothetical protein [Planomonospora sp. ID67723]